ncbi:MAG: helix-turn-helix transcriptional regulator [Planctomycetota bacterium]|nr:helix-turn-helix transcriptional regulator [Planctomycetota bacterium]
MRFSKAQARALAQMYGGRNLRIDGMLRSLTATGKAHGARPNQHQNAVFNQLCVNYVLHGRGTYTDRAGRSYDLAPGSAFHRLPGVPHSTWYDPGSDYTEIFVVFDPATGRQLIDLGLIETSPAPLRTAWPEPAILSAYRDLVRTSSLPEAEFPSRAAVLEAVRFLHLIYDRARSNRRLGFWERIVEDARSILEHNLEEPLRAEAVAEQLNVSYAAFRKHFKDATGYAPNDYRIRRRLEAAQHDLRTLSVKETARKYRYFDPFAFSAQFKRFAGCSPRDFKRDLRRAHAMKPLIRARPHPDA